jgi:hypothetical protein
MGYKPPTLEQLVAQGRAVGFLHMEADTYYESDQMLLCPQCTGIHTHIDTVVMDTASGRSAAMMAVGEDEGAAPSIPDEPVTTTTRTNWSNFRRHAFTLVLFCEECWHVTHIEFLQHKGNTFVRLEDQGRRSEPDE